MGTLSNDFRYGVRLLRSRPMFTAITVVSLALGIGANSAIFSVANAVMLRPLPYREPEKLVMVWEQNLKSGRQSRVGPDNFHEWRKNNHVFEEMAAVAALDQRTLTGGAAPEQVQLHQVSANFFPMLGIQPALGRVFSEKEDMPQATGKTESPYGDRVVILSHGLWQRRFGGDPGILGKSVHLDGVGHTVIGVLPHGFKFNEESADVWVPLGLDPAKSYFAAGFGRFLWIPARLKAGVKLEDFAVRHVPDDDRFREVRVPVSAIATSAAQKSCRSHTQRTPAGETMSPRFLNSLATRTWPKAGCSVASVTTAPSISCGIRFFKTGFLRLISCNASSPPLS